MIVWEVAEEPPLNTGFLADFAGVQKREGAPAENCPFEKGVRSTEKVCPPVTGLSATLGGEEDAQECDKERAKSFSHLVFPFDRRSRNLGRHWPNMVPYPL